MKERTIFLFVIAMLLMLLFSVWLYDFPEREMEKINRQIEKVEKQFKELKQRAEKKKKEERKKKKAIQPEIIIIPDDVVICLVKKGDSINLIAGKYRVLPYQLRKWNDLKFGCIIHPGQKLKIKKVKWPTYIGKASWYGPKFHGKKMANTEIYNQNDVLIAHRHLPLGLLVRITNLNNGKSIVAPVLDRGPYTRINGKYHREVDLSLGLAKLLDAVEPGIILVKIEPLEEV